jgi:glutathione synthase
VLPDNYSTKGLAAGIQHAFEAYGASVTGNPKCVLLVVQDGERNIFDQKHLEYEISAPPTSTLAFRVPFSALLQQTRLADAGSTKGRQLLFTPPNLPHHTFEVAVAYLRCAYGPGDYPAGSDAWEARYHLERSAAIKCPSVLTQVAGTKKVQQVLATPSNPSDPGAPSADNILHRFLHPAAHATTLPQLERTFANIYPLDEASAAGRRARELARDPARCVDYVLKPQREGGGNNIYGAAIPGYLRGLPAPHWDAHVLMELIRPPAVRNTILRMGALEHGGVICELGVFGACLWDASKGSSGNILYNETPGYLLRTKGDQSEEGGVAAGFGCMDSVTLVGEGGGPGSGERHEYIAKAV